MPTPPDAAPLPAGTSVGRYTIVRKLGEGGMAEVYLAHDPRLDRDVALKLLPVEVAADGDPATDVDSSRRPARDDRRARFEREARAAAALTHPNICTIHEVGEADGRAYIAMEYLEGATLSDCLATGPSPMPVAEVLDIAVQIADALEAAHARQIVHRDLKNSNVVVLPGGHVKVLDFGLAKRIPGTEGSGLHSQTTALATEAGLVVGTAAYMSPEQALGQPVDGRSDLFSLGVVLYELLTGRRPFAGRTPMELLNAVVNATPAPVPRYNDEVPDALVAVVTRLLAKRRDDRYHSAREVRDALQAVRAAGAAATTASVGPSRRRLHAVAGFALVVATASLAWLAWGRGPVAPADVSASVVVLPAQVFGPSFEHLADAVPATLSTFLASVDGLETKVPPNSVETRKLDDDAERIAALYDVDHYVKSMVFAEGATLRVNLQLVERRSRTLRWSQEFTGTSADYLTLIRRAADGLRAHLRPDSPPLADSFAETTNSEALLALETGIHRANRYNYEHDPAHFDAAERAFTRALELEPRLARAAAGLSLLYIVRAETGDPSGLGEAVRWGTLATEWDSDSGEGWAALAYAAAAAGDKWRGAELAFKAAAAGPRVALAQYALVFTEPPLPIQIAASRRATELDPLYPYPAHALGFLLLQQEQAGQALRYVDQALAVEPGLPSAVALRAVILAATGDVAGAGEAASLLRRLVADGRMSELEALGPLYAVDVATNRPDEAGRTMARLLELAGRPEAHPVMRYHSTVNALPFAASRNPDAGFRLLDLCLRANLLPQYDWLVRDSRLAPLRADPRFPPLLAAARRDFDRYLAIIQEARREGHWPGYMDEALAEVLKLAGAE